MTNNEKTTLTIESNGKKNFYSVNLKVGNKHISGGYVTNFKVSVESEFIMVFTYNNSENHNFYYAVDEAFICGEKIVPQNILDSYRAPTNYWLHPDSTNILKYKYDPQAKELYIVFHSNVDRLYTYSNVPLCLFIEMFETDSKGKYFSKNIRKNPLYPCESEEF